MEAELRLNFSSEEEMQDNAETDSEEEGEVDHGQRQVEQSAHPQPSTLGYTKKRPNDGVDSHKSKQASVEEKIDDINSTLEVMKGFFIKSGFLAPKTRENKSPGREKDKERPQKKRRKSVTLSDEVS